MTNLFTLASKLHGKKIISMNKTTPVNDAAMRHLNLKQKHKSNALYIIIHNIHKATQSDQNRHFSSAP